MVPPTHARALSGLRLLSTLGVDLSSELNPVTNALAKYFITRTDAKAKQVHLQSGPGYIVDTTDGKRESPRLPWNRAALEAHIQGGATYGHYLLGQDNTCKLMAFDVDFDKEGYYEATDGAHPFSPRDAWKDRAHPARAQMKYELKMMAALLAKSVYNELEIPVACAYSGGKGIHVYGFTGPMQAYDIRQGMQIVLDAIEGFALHRGQVFWKHEGFTNLTIEAFPKQDSLDGKDLGNLMRLPLGRNLQAPRDPTFFFDFTGPMGQLAPVDPIHALQGNPWKRPDE